MILAVVNNGVVTQVTPNVDPSLYSQYAQNAQACIDITSTLPQPQVGWIFTGSTLVSNGVVGTLITKLAFRERFTTSELLGVYTAIPTYPLLQIMIDNQAVSTFIDLSRSDTISGVDYLVSIGLLTLTRATTILTTPPSAMEIYQG